MPLWRVASVEGLHASERAIVVLDVRGIDDGEARVASVSAVAARHQTIAVVPGADAGTAFAYLEARAFGVLDPAASDRMALRRALLGALRGEPAFAREVLGRWLRHVRHTDAEGGATRLTARQREVIALVARGATDKEISLALEISLATAQKHVANVLKKLGATNRASAVSVALTASLIPSERPSLARRQR